MEVSQNLNPNRPRPRPRPSQRWRQQTSLPIQTWAVQHWQGNVPLEQPDRVVLEEPFEVRLAGRSLAVIMRTPGGTVENDRELALGFLLSEGLIAGPEQVRAIVRPTDQDGLPEENVLDVRLVEESAGLSAEAADAPERFERRFVVASSCGICGKNSIVEVCRRLPALATDDNFQVSPDLLYSLPDKLRSAQAVFERTGGLHAAGLFDRAGELLLLREDVGRHNAVDKLLGRSALDGHYPLDMRILLVSGRVSFEIVQKALAARIPLLAAVSAPSSLALDLAAEGGLTLVGFLRGQSMNVYTHPERISIGNNGRN